MVIGQLNAILGLAVNKQEWKEGEAHINHFRRLALVVGGLFAGKALGGALLGFNMSVENAKNQVAAMLALGSGSTMQAQLENANILYDKLRVKAAALPGETQDYVNMLGLLAQPMAQAKLDLNEMSDITAGAFVFSKGLGLQWQASARDLADFIKFGKINKTDQFLRTIMTGTGIEATKEGRAKAEGLGVRGRAMLVKQQTTGPLAQEVAQRLGSSFEGRLDTVKEGIKQTLGKVGKSLFETLKPVLDDLANWFTKNQEAIGIWANKVGKYIAGAFSHIKDGVLWLLDHQDVVIAFVAAISAALTVMMVRAALAWAAVAWPLFAGAALFLMFTKMLKVLGPIPTVLIAIGATAGLMWVGLLGPIGLMIIGAAAIGAAFYVAGDAIMAALDAVGQKIMWLWDKAKEFFDYLFGQAEVDMTGMTEDQKTTINSMFGPVRDTGAGAAGPVTVTQQNTVTIATKDAAGAKEAFDKKTMDWAANMRTALINTGGAK